MIRNIIFDYGGVIIDIDYNKPKEEFEKIGVRNFDAHFNQLNQTSLFSDFEKGLVTEQEFRSKLNQQLGMQLTDEQIDHCWNSMVLGIREEKIKLLSELYANNYKTFLLSNTNYIHLRFITKLLLRTHGRFNIDQFFNKVYYSCSTGMRKPEKEIFQKVLYENDLKPAETIYIDDSPQHKEAAEMLGLKSVLYDPHTDLREVLHQHLNAGNVAPAEPTVRSEQLTG